MRRWWWVAPAVAGLGLTFLIMVALPPDRTIDNVAEALFKISPLVLAVLAVAGFPQHLRIGSVLMVLLVIGYMGVVDTLNISHIVDYAESADQDAAFPALYQFTLFVNAFTVLAALFAYRLGGASTAQVVRVGFAAVLVVVSGLNDLTFYYTYGWPAGRPDRLDWASHIGVFVGGPPSATVAIMFCLVHLGLAAALLALPRWRRIRRAAARRRR